MVGSERTIKALLEPVPLVALSGPALTGLCWDHAGREEASPLLDEAATQLAAC